VLWIILYKAFNSKTKHKTVNPASANQETEYGAYTPNIPDKDGSGHPMVMTQQPSAPPTDIPDYNPEELFAAKRVDLPSDIAENNQALSNTLFMHDKNNSNDLVSGLNPGYMTTSQERQTAGVIKR